MAKGFKHGAGGTDALNFKVVGGTEQPENPKENTVWVNTGTEITSWEFSATQPIPPTQGMVWITSGTKSDLDFNVLKNNAVYVYPVGCQQYIGGEWASMIAYIYQGGAWVQFSSDFPDYWYHYEGHGWNTEMGSYRQWSSGSTVGTDEITIPVKMSGGDGLKVGIYQETAFDFTNFKSLKFEYKSDISSSNNLGVFIGIGGTTGEWTAPNWDAQMIFRTAVADWTSYEIDITSVNKTSHLRLMVWAEKGSAAHIRNITLE